MEKLITLGITVYNIFSDFIVELRFILGAEV